TNVSKVTVAGDVMVRLATDWWTDSAWLDIVPMADAESPEPLGRLSLADLGQTHPHECWGRGLYGAEIYAHAGYVFIVRDLHDYEQWTQGRTAIDVIDIRVP